MSYTHLAVLSQIAQIESSEDCIELLWKILKTVESSKPSKDALVCWNSINREMLSFGRSITELWRTEKLAMMESIEISKDHASAYYIEQRNRIRNMDRGEAIEELLSISKIENRLQVIENIGKNPLLEAG